jgi:hypothetical protein
MVKNKNFMPGNTEHFLCCNLISLSIFEHLAFNLNIIVICKQLDTDTEHDICHFYS